MWHLFIVLLAGVTVYAFYNSKNIFIGVLDGSLKIHISGWLGTDWDATKVIIRLDERDEIYVQRKSSRYFDYHRVILRTSGGFVYPLTEWVREKDFLKIILSDLDFHLGKICHISGEIL